MKTISFTEFRQQAAACLDAVEAGETVRVLRYGKPVADVVPVNKKKAFSWKRPIKPLKLKGVSISKEVINERDECGR